MKRALLLLVLVLAACTPLYLPPDPGARPPEPRVLLEIAGEVQDGRPQVSITVLGVPQPGWLAVQWFDPGNREVASESVWLSGDSEGLTRVLRLPDDVETASGSWRALLSMHSVVLRQQTVVVE